MNLIAHKCAHTLQDTRRHQPQQKGVGRGKADLVKAVRTAPHRGAHAQRRTAALFLFVLEGGFVDSWGSPLRCTGCLHMLVRSGYPFAASMCNLWSKSHNVHIATQQMLHAVYLKGTAGTASELRRLRSSHPGLLMHAVHGLGKCSSDLPYLMPMVCVSTAGAYVACRWAPTPFL